jgi:hypothetical protein
MMFDRPGSVQRNQIESSQYPDFWEFTEEPDVETVVKPKTAFVLELPEIRIGAWRFVPDGNDLLVQKKVAGAWVEQARFEP